MVKAKIVSEYDQEISKSQLQTPPWHREEELLNHHETPGRSKIANRVSGVDKANANITLPFANRKEELCSTLKQRPFIMMQRIYKIMQFYILDAAPSTKVLLKTTITNVNSSDSTAEAHILLMRGHRVFYFANYVMSCVTLLEKQVRVAINV